MMRFHQHLTYANVTATLALVLAAGAGGAWAIETIGSPQIEDNSIQSIDLRDRRAVTGADVKRGSLRGREITESALNASRFAPAAGDEAPSCNPTDSGYADCVSVGLDLPNESRVVAMATGGFASETATAANADCQIQVDDATATHSDAPGEATTDNTSSTATDGFARTLVTNPLPAGQHEIALACTQLGPEDAVIYGPTIAAFALTAR